MKNSVLALLCLFMGYNSVNAQRIGLTSIVLNQYGADNSRSVHDTVVPWGSNIITPRLYSSQNGGYIIGVNGFADRQMLQMFKDNKELYVYGALFWFGAKHYNSGNTSSAVTFKLFALDSNNLSNAQGINKQGPGTLLSQISLPLSSLVADTAIASGLNYIEFPQAVHIDSAAGYAIGFDVTSLSPGDTVGLISSSDGDGEQKDLSIEQWADGSWNSFLDNNNWDTDIDLFILAITDTVAPPVNTITGPAFTSQIVSVFPNPAIGYCYIVATCESANKTVDIYDAHGRCIKQFILNSGNSGTELPIADLQQGIYWLRLSGRDVQFKPVKLVVK